jgi:hypothetical protein
MITMSPNQDYMTHRASMLEEVIFDYLNCPSGNGAHQLKRDFETALQKEEAWAQTEVIKRMTVRNLFLGENV